MPLWYHVESMPPRYSRTGRLYGERHGPYVIEPTLLDAVDETSGLLAGSPLCGSPVDTSSSDVLADCLRWTRIDSYKAIYRADEDSRVVYLLKLLHGMSNWRRRVLS